jgi:hypothetical protein
MTKAMEFPWPTVGGYDFYEVLSALQKSIRRGAILTLVRAPKSRIADHATIVFFEGTREPRELPD